MDITEQTKAFFNRLAGNWDENCTHDPRKIETIITLAGIKKDSRVVDIGCGTGVLFNEILSREPSELLGIDLSDQMIAAAKRKYNDKRLRLLAADLFSVEEKGFDVATVYSAYPHFPDKQKLAEKAADMLTAGGRIIIAHSQSKEAINSHHQGAEVSQLSTELLPAKLEAEHFSKIFDIDILIDTQEMYVISGIKK